MSRAALLFLTLIALACAALPPGRRNGPVLRGRVVAADGAPVGGMRAVVRWQAPGGRAAAGGVGGGGFRGALSHRAPRRPCRTR